MKEISICVADEVTNKQSLKKLICAGYNIDIINEGGENISSRMSHGTLCTSLLMSSVQAYNISNQVHIVHFSISTCEEPRSYAKLLKAFDFCASEKIDILSLSVGVSDRLCAPEMCGHMKKLADTLVVATAANTFSLTYPAAFSEALGVKRSLLPEMTKYVRSQQSPDGIELVANLPTNVIVNEFQENYGIVCVDSNSVIAPQVCADIAFKSLEFDKRPTKELALNWLAREVMADERIYDFPRLSAKEDDDKSPVIFLPRGTTGDTQLLNQVFELQNQFESRGYVCGIISDMFHSCDFKRGRYRLDSTNIVKCIDFYQNVTSKNPLLLLSNNTLINEEISDMCVYGWWNMQGTVLCDTILRKFSGEVL